MLWHHAQLSDCYAMLLRDSAQNIFTKIFTLKVLLAVWISDKPAGDVLSNAGFAAALPSGKGNGGQCRLKNPWKI